MSYHPAKPETKRDKASAQTRRKILEAAVACFLEDGYHQTGVRSIAKRAGVSLGNLYNHFPGKHDVLAEVAALERAELEPFLKLLAKPSPPPKVLAKFVAGYAKYLSAPENVILSIEITSEAIRKPDIAEMFLGNRADLIAALAAVLERGIIGGDFRRMSATGETAHLILEMIEGSAYRCVLGGIPMRKLLKGVREFIFAALRKQCY